MPDIVFIVAGAILVALVFFDALATTLAVSSGAGPVTTGVLGAAWRVALRLHRQDKKGGLLTFSGPVMLIVTVLTWVALLWAGWTLLFYGSDAVETASKARPAGFGDVVYFAGFTIFTLGTGDFVASTPAWRIVMAAATFSGLFLITLAITYLLSVLSAVVARRVLAQQIHGLGDTPSEILKKGWTGDGFDSMFQQQLVSLSSSVAGSAEQHLAYPVLHYFHSSSRDLAAPVAIAHLDEALTVIETLETHQRPQPAAVDPLRSSIGRYLSTASSTTWAPKIGAPAPPEISEAIEAGIPVNDTAVRRAAEEHSERRTHLHRLVASDGWSWQGA
ncbi:two pore domain potassium channel family protein [Nocardioides sp. IC4_145]|uniref:potassium channel family protein n=1 Tax=Nocardioides sp. IC4_145 TaxID=2714037 RepID=UPI00140AB063|nr:potassium channel family protein [Nocardioides sp. IC4_145]NHC22925.1 two pore domain potassium channel family protein [Nocardioides sp. IC4_145]